MASKKGFFVGFTESGRRWGTIVPTWKEAMKEEERYKGLRKKRVSTTESFSLKKLVKITENFFQKK